MTEIKRLFDIDIGPTDEGREVIEVSVYYSLGGINFMSYKQEPRGYYVMVTPCTVGDGFRTYRIGLSKTDLGFKQCIATTKRLNRKQLQWYRNAVEQYVSRRRLKTLILSGDKANAWLEILAGVELARQETAA